MSSWRYILASLRHYRRIHLAVAAGVAVAAAVITGALLVGDSMRGSLLELALRGLGRVDSVLLAEHPFRAKLAEEWMAAPAARERADAAVPLLLTQGAAVAQRDGGEVRRAAQLQVIGAPREFWALGPSAAAAPELAAREIALTAAIAQELGVEVGDAVLLRLPLTGSVPADSTLGEKEQTMASRRLTVAAVLSEGDGPALARFSLQPSQQAPRNVFVALETLQDLLELPGRANAIAVAGGADGDGAPLDDEQRGALAASLEAKLADYGLSVSRVAPGGQEEHAYLRISADRLVLPPHVVEVAEKVFKSQSVQPVVTYLANTIAAGERSIPYSTVAGVDSTPALGPVLDGEDEPVELADDEIALNDWAAEDLGVGVGDKVSLTWYEPETTHGKLREPPPLELTVRAIVPLGDRRPTAAADPQFAPELPGVTDQRSIDEWDLPFELVETIRREDEDYWEEYRTTPKAFIAHDLAAKLWRSRWGVESVLRLPLAETDGEGAAEDAARRLRAALDPAEMGMTLLPVKRDAMAAASGTTPFDGLFLGFSFFLMAAAVMLVALLYRLGIEQRTREAGLLLAVGTTPRRAARLLTVEGAVVATAGALVGAAAGVGYARVMVYGLNTWWVAATTTPFLELHVTARSLAVGFFAGLVVALVTMAWSLRQFFRMPAQQLLAGQAQTAMAVRPLGLAARVMLPAGAIIAAIGLGFWALRLNSEARSMAFMGGGALVMVGVLAAVRAKLRETGRGALSSLSLAGLAARSARRNPSRTMLALGLAASASYLIVALSAFRLAPDEQGVGGFDVLADADLPIHFDLTTLAGRRQLGFTRTESERLKGAEIVGMRVREGEDASCLNLYQTRQPRVLGAPAALEKLSRFAWAATATDEENDANGWSLLAKDLGEDAAGRAIVPVVFDRNTAFYSLKLYKIGDQLVIQDGLGGNVTLQIVALLANSVLQGDAIIGEANFVRIFPEQSGQRFFLIRRGAETPPPRELATMLETQLEDYGFDAVDARVRLGELLAVQNTYLSTFQSLGALGLLLGVVGLAVVQLRSVLERRGELALMQATGFRRRRLAAMVLAENVVLLAGGLAIGCVAALAVVLPHALVERAGVPWATLAALLAVVAVAGVAAAWAASRSVLRAPLMPALRGE